MDVVSLNYWLSKFVMEVAKKSGHRSNALFQYEKPTEENVSKVSNILGPSTSVVSTSTCTTIEKREEQHESIALKDVVFEKGNFNNCTINVSI